MFAGDCQCLPETVGVCRRLSVFVGDCQCLLDTVGVCRRLSVFAGDCLYFTGTACNLGNLPVLYWDCLLETAQSIPLPGKYLRPSSFLYGPYIDPQQPQFNQNQFLTRNVFMVLRFVLVAGIIISLCGLLYEIYHNVLAHVKMMVMAEPRKLGEIPSEFDDLTFRELQYIKYIRQNNDILYTEICNLLRIGKKETLL